MQRQFSAGLVLFNEDTATEQRDYLLLHYLSGHWDFPKGKIEKGETKHQAALRELHEETGLTAEILLGFEEQFTYWFRNYDDGELLQKTVYFFIGKTDKKEVTLSREHTAYAWLPFDQALERLTYDNAKEMLTKVEKFLEA
jgi:8-oxo-dGTP pyrophosphatase MutT (NUDIX family)